jgi:hypothetical protein
MKCFRTHLPVRGMIAGRHALCVSARNSPAGRFFTDVAAARHSFSAAVSWGWTLSLGLDGDIFGGPELFLPPPSPPKAPSNGGGHTVSRDRFTLHRA